MSPRLRVGARSDVGLQRHNNQDSMYAGPRLIAVADGVGGAAGGEVASSVTITALRTLDTDGTDDVAGPDHALRDAAEAADRSIRDTIARDPGLAGMSTTLTAILATDRSLTLAHIGDSRAYLLRDGVLTQLTHDHTLVQSLIDDGQITAEEALTHPRRSWITRALDGRGSPELDLTTLDVRPGDRYLVCSDGLSSYVDEQDIAAGLASEDPRDAAHRLTELALAAGGQDNVSCIVADPVDDEAATEPPVLGGAVAEPPPEPTAAAPGVPRPSSRETTPRTRARRIAPRLAAVAGVLILLVGAAVAGVAIYVHRQFYVAPAGGHVAVYQGVQGNAAGIQLSHLHQVTNIPVTALPQDDRDRVSSGIQASGGQSGAAAVVANLRQEACALATPNPSPLPTATASASRGSKQTKKPSPAPSVVSPPPPAWCEAAQ
jgi:PPM family protein phosphatase